MYIFHSINNKVKNYQKVIIITDDNVNRLYGASLQKQFTNCHIIDFPSGEVNKNNTTVNNIYHRMMELNVKRNDLIQCSNERCRFHQSVAQDRRF